METRINAVRFDIAEKLEQFINKKADKLAHRNPGVNVLEFTLKVEKPETAMNKQAIVRAIVPNVDEIVADKKADTFEEAIDLCLEAVDRQLEKLKNRK